MSDTPYSLSQLYCYLTEGCNLACRHCWLAPGFDPEGSKYPVLAVEAFEQAVKEAIPLGLSTVKLTGGEPMLHPRFPDFLKIIRKHDLGLNIETNGTLCDREIARRIADTCNGPFVSVSIDGADAGTHEAIRGVPGSFQKACQAVEHLASLALAPQIIFTLMRSNADQINDMAHLAKCLGASSVKFNIVQPVAKGKKCNPEMTIDKIIETGRYVEKNLANKTALSLIFDYPPAFHSLSRIKDDNGCHICNIRHILGLTPGGHYALCGIGKHVPELIFGKTGKDALAHTWQNHAILSTLRDGLPERLEGICTDCLMKYRCFGSCIAQNYYRTHHLWSPFWFCEMADAAGRFPKTRRLSTYKQNR